MVVRRKTNFGGDFGLNHATDAQIRTKKNQTLTRLGKPGTNSNTIKVGLEYIAMLDRELERRKNEQSLPSN